MATSLQMEENMAKEVLVYRAVVDYVRALEAIKIGSSLEVMSSGYNQEHNTFKIMMCVAKNGKKQPWTA